MAIQRTYYLSDKQAETLKNLAKSKGYVARRGRYTGEGSVSRLLQALAEGELTAIKLGGKK